MSEPYDFRQQLKTNEKILYEGRAEWQGPYYGNIPGALFVIIFCLFIMAMLILSVVFKIGDGEAGINPTFLIIFAVAIFFLLIGVYIILYDLFIKKWRIANNYYCITNQRILKYNAKKDKLVYGYIKNYYVYECTNLKNGYGDITFATKTDKTYVDDIEAAKDIFPKLFFPDKTNMFTIAFLSVHHPYELKKLIEEQKKQQQ